ncbi:hypothetical protein BP00DRAFT_463683, partial [Aspergillus indologenus CBS 114.80]
PISAGVGGGDRHGPHAPAGLRRRQPSLRLAPSQEGAALCLQNFAQIGGSVIALVITGQVFQTYAQSGLTAALAGTGYTTADVQSIVAGAQSALFQDLDAEHKTAAILAITKAIQKVFILVCVGG